MQDAASPVRNSTTMIATAIVAIILGYLYVQAFAAGWRAIFMVHALVLFFLGCALFIRDLRSFLLFVMIFAIPLQYGYHVTYQPLPEIETSPFSSGLRIDIVDVMLLLLYIHWGFSLAQQTLRRAHITLGGPIGKLLLIWTGYVLVAGILKAEHLNYTLYEVVELFKGFLLFFYLANNLTSARDLRVVIYALFANTIAQGLFIIFQYVTRLNYNVHGELSTHFVALEGFRPAGFSGSWDESAAIMALALPALVLYYFVIKDKARHRAALISIGIVLLALILTKVRGAYFAFFISAVTAVAMSYWRGWITATQTFWVVFAAAGVLILGGPFIVHRLVTGTWGQDRIPLMLTAINMFKANWLLGVGANNYFFHIQQYLPVRLSGTWQYTVHNEYLQWAAETGLLGFLLYYTLVLVMMRKLWRLTVSADPWIFMASLGFFTAVLGSLLYRMSSPYFFQPLYSEFCAILGITYLLGVLEKRRLSGASTAAQSFSGSRMKRIHAP